MTSAHPADDPRIAHKEALSAALHGHEVYLVAPQSSARPPEPVVLLAVNRSQSRIARAVLGSAKSLLAARKTHADVYHLHDSELLLWVPLFRLITRGAVIFDSHESLPDQVMSKNWLPRWSRPVVSATSRLALRVLGAFCTGIVHAVPYTLGSFGKRPEALVRNYPILAEEAQPCSATPSAATPVQSETGALRAVYVGAISRIRGSEEMIRLCADLGPAHQFSLTLAGTVEPESHLEELRSLPGWQCVDYRGRIDHAQIPEVLAQADVGLALLHPVPNYVVSYPTKVFEYIAAGLAVVASDFPFWRELFSEVETVVFVDPVDRAAVAKAVLELAEDSDERRAACARSRAYVIEHLNWAHEYDRLAELYATVTKA